MACMFEIYIKQPYFLFVLYVVDGDIFLDVISRITYCNEVFASRKARGQSTQ
jgi:hypothetical protein